MENIGGFDSRLDEATRPARTITRSGSSRGMEPNRWRIYRGALNAGSTARRNLIRPGSSAGFALRSRTSFQDRHLAQVEATLRRKNHSRYSFPYWVNERYRCSAFGASE